MISALNFSEVKSECQFMYVGPYGGVHATRNARRTVSGIWPAARADHVSFVIGSVSCSCPGSSSKPSRPAASDSSVR